MITPVFIFLRACSTRYVWNILITSASDATAIRFRIRKCSASVSGSCAGSDVTRANLSAAIIRCANRHSMIRSGTISFPVASGIIFLSALMFNLEDEDFAVKAFDSVSEYVVTDMSVDQISDMAERISDYEYIGVHDIAGEARMGERYIEFYADKDKLRQQIIELFYIPA